MVWNAVSLNSEFENGFLIYFCPFWEGRLFIYYGVLFKKVSSFLYSSIVHVPPCVYVVFEVLFVLFPLLFPQLDFSMVA